MICQNKLLTEMFVENFLKLICVLKKSLKSLKSLKVFKELNNNQPIFMFNYFK